MGKTPDEIKKGLECCSTKKPCTSCPMWDECKEASSLKPLWDSALAYIQQLETKCHQQKSTISQVSKALCSKENATAEEIIAAFSQVKRERDAICTDLKEVVIICSMCRHGAVSVDAPPCVNCGTLCKTGPSNFEWRGVKEE